MRAIAGVLSLLLVLGLLVVTNDPSVATNSCPLPAGGQIVDLTDERLVGWDQGPNSFGHVHANVDAGMYRIMVASYDPHSAKSDQVQDGEQWYFRGYSDHAQVFTSPTTPDLDDSLDVATFTIADRVDLPALDAITAFHAHTGSNQPNSVAPLCIGFYQLDAPPPTVPVSASCPLTDGIVVEITSQKLLADSANRATYGPITVSIPAGTYDIALASFDDHTNKPDQDQHREHWFAALNGSEYESPSLGDLPEGKNYLTGVVAKGVSLPQGVNQITAKHAAYPSDRPESVAPICMAFVPQPALKTPEPPDSPDEEVPADTPDKETPADTPADTPDKAHDTPADTPTKQRTPADDDPPNNETPADDDPPNNETPADDDPPNNETPADDDPPNNETPADDDPPNNETPADDDPPNNETPADDDPPNNETPADDDPPNNETPADDDPPNNETPADDDPPNNETPADDDPPNNETPADDDPPNNETPADDDPPNNETPADDDPPNNETPADDDPPNNETPAGTPQSDDGSSRVQVLQETTDAETLGALPETGAKEWVLYLALIALMSGYGFLVAARRLESDLHTANLRRQITDLD